MGDPVGVAGERSGFQCSSASRKFLNRSRATRAQTPTALSVLFSEPKIPQFAVPHHKQPTLAGLSVLFSEPKIPQLEYKAERRVDTTTFQCSSASRKFLNIRRKQQQRAEALFQCSSASRKFLNCTLTCWLRNLHVQLSVLFSEPKIPQWYKCSLISNLWDTFQCSSASRKFLNCLVVDAQAPV